MKLTYKEITTTAKFSQLRTIKDKILFHCFNPNGLCARKQSNDDTISALVDAGKARSGAILAYGSLNYFHVDRAYKLLHGRCTGIELEVWMQSMEEHCETQEAYIAKPLPPAAPAAETAAAAAAETAAAETAAAPDCIETLSAIFEAVDMADMVYLRVVRDPSETTVNFRGQSWSVHLTPLT